MAVLKYRADSDGEGAAATAAPAQASAYFRGRVWRDVGKLLLDIAFAMRTDDAVFPKHGFKMIAGLVIRAETVK